MRSTYRIIAAFLAVILFFSSLEYVHGVGFEEGYKTRQEQGC